MTNSWEVEQSGGFIVPFTNLVAEAKAKTIKEKPRTKQYQWRLLFQSSILPSSKTFWKSLIMSSVQEYLDKHMLSRKIEDAVNAAVRAKTPEPVLFIVITSLSLWFGWWLYKLDGLRTNWFWFNFYASLIIWEKRYLQW